MPLVEPLDSSGRPTNLREKILLIAEEGAGKTTAWLSIAWWAFISGDTRKFYVLDTDDEAVLQVMNEPKYDGMLHSVNDEVVNEGGNILVWQAYEWDEYKNFSDYSAMKYSPNACVLSRALKGDWVIIDFITHAWNAAQEGWLHDSQKKTRGQAIYEQAREGKTGWDLFSVDFNWNAINGNYFDFIKPINLMSRAHLFFTSEMGEINEGSRNLNPDDREHLQKYGKYKFVGQKKLGHQCRSYLRTQQLARGRVLFTNRKDRARKVLDGDTITPDFYKFYLEGIAGWKTVDPG